MFLCNATNGLSGLKLDVFEARSALGPQAPAGCLDPLQKTWIAFQAIVEPIIFRLEADQNTSRLAMARNHNLLFLGQS